MSFGLGQMIIGGLIGSQLGKGGLLGSNEEDKQPQQGGAFGGIGNVVTDISNSLFEGMSQEQVAKLGLGFNSMRLNPSDNLASSFRTTIDNSVAQRKLEKQTNDTITYLQGLGSAQYPNGRTDLISMLQKGIITPTQAISESMKVTKPSALAEKFDKYTELVKHYGGAKNIPANELQLLNITQNDVTSIQEYEYYKDNTSDPNPVGYLEFINMKTPQTNIDLGDKQENDFWSAYNKKRIDDLIKYESNGGADQISNIVKLKDALYELEKPNSMLTGPIIGMVPDLVNAFLNPGAIDVRENIESVIQRNLRAVLGAQFTEKEGVRLIQRAYNPKLSPERNARRLRLLIEAMEQAAMAQDAALAWIKNPDNKGSFQYFTGAEPNMNDMWTAISQYKVGDIIEGRNGRRYEYIGGDSNSPASFKLIEE